MLNAEPASLHVIKPGWCTTVQDLGRQGYQHYGISVSGAMDRLALVIANRLAHNDDAAAALEITLVGPELVFQEAAILAITGADLSPAIDGHTVPMWTTLAISARSRLSFGRRRTGARSYLAVAGGFDVPLIWESQSTHLSSGAGGVKGRALTPDDTIGVRPYRGERPQIGATLAPSSRPVYADQPALRVIPGPQEMAGALSILTSRPYQISSQSDRMGYRLEGPRMHYVADQPSISEGTAMGAVQIPPDGAPILLMADRPTTGGYPKIATVITADLSQAAQLQPGDRLTFRTTTLYEAESALASQWRQLNDTLPRRTV